MKRREFIKTAALGAAALALPRELQAVPLSQARSKERRPNIIFILADDVGLPNISCYGADEYKTPQIDALARSGTRFEHCYSTPLCGPSRAEILTGRYPFRTGMTSNQTGALLKPANEIMMPTVLKAAGYATVHAGKWGQLPDQPGDWGFDEYLRFLGNGKYWREQINGYTVNGKQLELPEGRYLPDVMHEYLVDFLARHRDRPFYAYYPMSHIHGPILQTPDSKPGSDHYTDNVAYMDKLVGKLVAELERLKLRENTLVLFAGDNGTAGGHASATVKGRRLSGQKATMLEGGSLVPLIASWPAETPAGKVSQDLIDFSDFFPTFAELAGGKVPEGVTIDGRSFAAQLQGRQGAPREWIYVELQGQWYARTARWKLNNAGELFDMSAAPFVEKPVPPGTGDAEAMAARARLQAVLDQLNPAAGKQSAPRPLGAKKQGRAKKAAAGRKKKRSALGPLPGETPARQTV
jgi:arylsulfatase A